MADFQLLLERLSKHNFEFVVIGAFAAVIHGASIVTRDIDVCCPFDKENLLKLRDALADVHPVHRMTPARLPLEITDDSSARLKNLYLQTDIGPLDCLSEVAGVGAFAEVKAHSIEVQFSWGAVRVIELDALITAKSLLNRLQDKLVIPQLLAIKERQHGNRH